MDRYQAEEEIESNLRAGAVAEYVDGDTALEVLGDLTLLLGKRKPADVSMDEHLREVNVAIAERLSQFCDQVVSDNVEFVQRAAAEDRRHARSNYVELTTERVH